MEMQQPKFTGTGTDRGLQCYYTEFWFGTIREREHDWNGPKFNVCCQHLCEVLNRHVAMSAACINSYKTGTAVEMVTVKKKKNSKVTAT